ncbi:hypothetical protein K3495_g8373 [Podosphaera aphanis]|nr:hypothetical protein K3495_g8373 [Podosphaera aphanis]
MKLENFAAISTLFASAYAVSIDPASVQVSNSRSLEKRVNPGAIDLGSVTYFQCAVNQFYPTQYIMGVMKQACEDFKSCGTQCQSLYPMAFTTCPPTEIQFFSRSNDQLYYRYPIFPDLTFFQNVENAKVGSDFVLFNDQCIFAGVARKPQCTGNCAGTPHCRTRERKVAPNLPLNLCEPIMGQPQLGQPQFRQPQLGQPQFRQPQLGQPQFRQPQLGQPQFRQPHPGRPHPGRPQ